VFATTRIISPFGLRCSNIHDPRVAGSNSSWLPHCDVPVLNLRSELMVDKSYHQNLAALTQVNPLVQNLIWEQRPSLKKKGTNDGTTDTEWRDTYSLVCNLANLNPTKKPKANIVTTKKISELQRLCIAAHMTFGREPTSSFVYKPKHLVYNELCMVVS